MDVERVIDFAKFSQMRHIESLLCHDFHVSSPFPSLVAGSGMLAACSERVRILALASEWPPSLTRYPGTHGLHVSLEFEF